MSNDVATPPPRRCLRRTAPPPPPSNGRRLPRDQGGWSGHSDGAGRADLMPGRRTVRIRRRHAIAALLVAMTLRSPVDAQTTLPANVTEPATNLYAIEIRVGAGWDATKHPNEQAYFREHSANLKRLRDEGRLVLGARYSDKGLVVVRAASDPGGSRDDGRGSVHPRQGVRLRVAPLQRLLWRYRAAGASQTIVEPAIRDESWLSLSSVRPGPAPGCMRDSNASTSGQWRALMEVLAPRFHVLAPDSYGSGKSPDWPSDRIISLHDEVALIDPVLARAGSPLRAGGPFVRRRGCAHGGPVGPRSRACNGPL